MSRMIESEKDKIPLECHGVYEILCKELECRILAKQTKEHENLWKSRKRHHPCYNVL